MISSQYGKVFQNAEYEKIEKVYSIWVCMNPPKYRGNTIARYRLVEENMIGAVKEAVQDYDLLSVIMICLGGPEADHYDGVLRMLDVLFSSRNSVEQKKQILQDDYGIQMTQTLEREVSELSGLWVGVEQRGHAEGIREATLTSIRNIMDSLGLSIEQAMSALKIPDAERPGYASIIAKQ